MKRSIINQLNQLSEQLKGYVSALNYRYLNLCVKAEEVSLLPLQVVIEGEAKNLEDVAYAGKRPDDDYSLYVIPKYQDDLQAIAEATTTSHPEFIQKVERQTVEPGDGSTYDVEYLKLTMPEVNDDRYDILKQGADTFYNMCKADMEKAKLEADIQLVALGSDETPENMNLLKEAVNETNDMWVQKREEIHEKKLKEIEDAHNQWLTNQQASARKQQEADAAHNQNVGTSMRLMPEEE